MDKNRKQTFIKHEPTNMAGYHGRRRFTTFLDNAPGGRDRSTSINFANRYGAEAFDIAFEDDAVIEREHSHTVSRTRTNTMLVPLPTVSDSPPAYSPTPAIVDHIKRKSILKPHAGVPNRIQSRIGSVVTIQQRESIQIPTSGVTIVTEQETNWKSIYLLTAVSTLAGIQFSVFFTSLWPFLNTVDPTAGATFFGIITACYSFGQAIFSPLFGWWSNKSKAIRPPLTAGLIIMIVSNAIYACVELFPEHSRRWVMLAARFCVGSGSGIVGIMRAYAATASTLKDRAKAITYLSASFMIGLTIGPFVQIAFTPIGYPGWKIGSWSIDMYTSPALFASICNLISLIFLYTIFQEYYAGIIQDEQKEDPFLALPKPKVIPASICIFTQFTLMFIVTNSESVGSMYTIAMFEWTDSKAVLYNGFIGAGSSIVSLVLYVALAYGLGNYISKGREKNFTILGLILILVYHLVTYPWPFFPGKPGYTFEVTHSTTEYIGCYTSTYKWCEWTHKVPLWVYIAAQAITALNFPLVTVANNTLYSKVLGSRRQGTMQGIQMMAGSLARCIGPLLVTWVFNDYGPEVTWLMEIGVLAICIAGWVVFYRQIQYLDMNPVLKPGESYKYDKGTKYRF